MRLGGAGHSFTGLVRLVRHLLLPYLRTAALVQFAQFDVPVRRRLRHHRYGVARTLAHAPSELDKLLVYAALPPLHEVAATVLGPTNGGTPLPAYGGLVQRWCAHWRASAEHERDPAALAGPPLAYARPYQLVPLPQRFDVLLRLGSDAVCVRCGSVQGDPALCLLCGATVCSTRRCLLPEAGVLIHATTSVPPLPHTAARPRRLPADSPTQTDVRMHRHHAGLGLYLLDKKCVILMVHAGNSVYKQAPYLDIHGEADPGLRYVGLRAFFHILTHTHTHTHMRKRHGDAHWMLGMGRRRGRPLELNVRQVQDLQYQWVSHRLSATVARSFDHGNYEWITLPTHE
jgi:hypothetical protein